MSTTNQNNKKTASEGGQMDDIVMRIADLEKRVWQFNTMALPGQPMVMHMGTNYLVNDLWRELKQLYDKLKSA